MRYPNRVSLPAAIVAALLLVLGVASAAQADPFTTHLDALIAELDLRSAALDGATDKVELKQKKTLDKLLKLFAKESKGPDKDLKAAGKAAKSLAKVFPEEFASEGAATAGLSEATLADLILQALALFDGDIDALLGAAQTLVDGAPVGKCQDKAQSALDQVDELLAAADAAPDLPSQAKALAKALKKTLKVESLAEKALGCVPKLSWNISTATVAVNGASQGYLDDALAGGPDEVQSTLFQNGSLFIAVLGQNGLNLNFFVSSSEIGTHDVVADFIDVGGQSVQFLLGTVTITKFGTVPDHLHGSFQLGTLGTEVSGSFAIYTYDTGGV